MAETKRKIRWSSAWADARELVWAHRRRLLLGAVLMIVNQSMGLVLPASTKYLIDVVIGKGRTDLLWKIALAAAGCTAASHMAAETFGDEWERVCRLPFSLYPHEKILPPSRPLTTACAACTC